MRRIGLALGLLPLLLGACNQVLANKATVYPPVSGLFDINWRLSIAGVSSVEFFIDDRPIGTDGDGSNGFAMEFDSQTVPNGLHRMRAVARNAAGVEVASVEHSLNIEN